MKIEGHDPSHSMIEDVSHAHVSVHLFPDAKPGPNVVGTKSTTQNGSKPVPSESTTLVGKREADLSIHYQPMALCVFCLVVISMVVTFLVVYLIWSHWDPGPSSPPPAIWFPPARPPPAMPGVHQANVAQGGK
jgi:hypothetical protein